MSPTKAERRRTRRRAAALVEGLQLDRVELLGGRYHAVYGLPAAIPDSADRQAILRELLGLFEDAADELRKALETKGADEATGPAPAPAPQPIDRSDIGHPGSGGRP